MLIGIPGHTFETRGSRIKSVICQKCGTHYYYKLTRVGTGHGVGWPGPSDFSVLAAHAELDRRLASEAELVPCPRCHWLNQDLIDGYRKAPHPTEMQWLTIVALAGLTGPPLLFLILAALLNQSMRVLLAAAVAAFCIFLAIFSVLLARRWRRQCINPNRNYPRPPVLPPGTPPALLSAWDPHNNAPGFKVATRPPDAADNESDWVVFRHGQIRFPPLCCACLAPATASYRSPLAIMQNDQLDVPICPRCAHRRRLKWRGQALLTLCLAEMAGALIYNMVAPHMDAYGRWWFTIVGAVAALCSGLMLATRLSRPFTIHTLDADREVYRFKAASPAFNQILLRQVHQSDGISADPALSPTPLHRHEPNVLSESKQTIER